LDSGAQQTIFYAEVDDNMKVSEGGGNISEQEDIEVVYMPIEDARRVLVEEDETVQRCSDLMFSVLWFFEYKVKT
jgi:UDP-sugar diphosphatase